MMREREGAANGKRGTSGAAFDAFLGEDNTPRGSNAARLTLHQKYVFAQHLMQFLLNLEILVL